MIGQKLLLDSMVTLPRFTIITGSRGQGKKTLAKEIAKKFDLQLVMVGTKIDDIRYMIDTAYKQTNRILYLIADADGMSLGAKNSILKVIEEPPQNAFFIMTLEQIENTLPTIKSRCYEIQMLPYSYDNKLEMIQRICGGEGNIIYDHEIEILTKLDNYWEIEKVNSYKTIEFYQFVRQVADCIYTTSAANSFKIANRLDLKDDGNGYDLYLFFSMYEYCCLEDLSQDKVTSNLPIIGNCLNITSKYKRMLSVKGISKQMLVDMWILNIRKEWLTSLN